MELTQLSTIRDLCARHGFSLSKGFGQNFIVNPGVCPKMVQAAEQGVSSTGLPPSWYMVFGRIYPSVQSFER